MVLRISDQFSELTHYVTGNFTLTINPIDPGNAQLCDESQKTLFCQS